EEPGGINGLEVVKILIVQQGLQLTGGSNDTQNIQLTVIEGLHSRVGIGNIAVNNPIQIGQLRTPEEVVVAHQSDAHALLPAVILKGAGDHRGLHGIIGHPVLSLVDMAGQNEGAVIGQGAEETGVDLAEVEHHRVVV